MAPLFYMVRAHSFLMVLAEAVAGGVRNGSFGLAQGTPDDINPKSVRFEEALPHGGIGFTENEMLVSADRAKALLEQIKLEPEPGPGPQPGSGPQPPPPGPQPGGTSTTGGTSPTPRGVQPPKEKVHRVAFRASGIPSGKMADLFRGVFNPLTREAGAFEFTIEIDVTSADGISTRTIEQQVMETLQQIGAKVERQ